MTITTAQYLSTVIDDMFRFEDELQKISLKVYPSPALRALIKDELTQIVRQLRQILINDKECLMEDPSLTTSPVTKAVEKIWRDGYIQEVAYAISNTEVRSYPLEIMTVFRDMIQEIEGDFFEIITVPRDEMNFTFRELWVNLKNFLTSTLGLQGNDTDKKFIELTFPRKHRDNVLLAGIYAHEIGHYFDHNRKIWAKVFTQIVPYHDDLREISTFIISKKTNAPLSEPYVVQFLQEVVLSSWIKEAIADCVAIHLMGPAFIFATMDMYISLLGPYLLHKEELLISISRSHPPSHLRNKLQMEVLHDLQLTDSMEKSLLEILEGFSAQFENAKIIYPNSSIDNDYLIFHENEDFYKHIIKIWNDCLPIIKEEVRKLVGSQSMKKEEMAEAQRLAVERLKYVIPPNELDGKSVSSKAIINSGWITRLLYKDDFLSQMNRVERSLEDYHFYDYLNGLLKYALQASHIQRRWEQ